MRQHLGSGVNSSMLHHLSARGLEPRDCSFFRLVADGSILPAGLEKDVAEHRVRRDVIAGVEKRWAEELNAAGYDVVSTVTSTKPLDQDLYAGARAAVHGPFHARAKRPNAVVTLDAAGSLNAHGDSESARRLLFLVAGVMLATAAIAFCPLHALLGVNTCPRRMAPRGVGPGAARFGW
jgi:DUF2892 family protein